MSKREREKLLRTIAEKKAKFEEQYDLNVKVPKIPIPENITFTNPDLFKLPAELMQPSTSKKKRKLLTKEEEEKLKSYTALRREREKFRQKLVDLIIHKEEESELDADEIPTATEREALRYYYYIHHGIDTVHVSPLDDKTLEKILCLVPKKLQVWDDVLKKEVDETRQDFMMSVKQAIVDFVLKHPSSSEEAANEFDSPERRELKEMADEWKLGYSYNHKRMEQNLHIINPCIAQILDLWYRKYSTLRLINVSFFSKAAVSLEDFERYTTEQIHTAQNTLYLSYFQEVQQIFMLGSKKGKLPNPTHANKMKKFYEAVACLMSRQLQVLCLESLEEYTHFLHDIGYSNRGFIINVVHRNKTLMFDPPFPKFRETLLKIYDSMIDAVHSLPRLETKLYMGQKGGE